MAFIHIDLSHTNDGDGDGWGPLACGGLDCDDDEPLVNPGRFEASTQAA